MDPTTNGMPRSVTVDPLGVPARMILLGYYDGPTEGVIQFESRAVYRFVMPDEENQLCRQSFPREYVFHPLPTNALDRLEAVLAEHLVPQRPAWYVNWEFETPEIECEMADRVGAILAEARPAAWLVTVAETWQFEDFRPIRVVALHAV